MNYYIDTEFHEYHKQHKICGIKIGKAIPTIDLISIGIVSEDIKFNTYPTRVKGIPLPKVLESTKSRSYYAISKDFNIKDAWNSWQLSERWANKSIHGDYREKYKEYWLRYNVLKPIFKELWKRNTSTKEGYSNTKDYIKSTDFTYKSFKYLINKYGKTNKEIAEEVREFVYYSYSYNQIENANINLYGYYADYDWVVFAQLFGKMINLPRGFPIYCKDLKQELDNKYTINNNHNNSFDTWLIDIKAHSNYPKQDNEHNALDDAKWNKKLHKFIKNL